MDDAYGIFVSPNGNDQADGRKLTPVNTIEKGMELAMAAGKRVYACSGARAYDERLTLAAELDLSGGIEIYGGLTCPDASGIGGWQYQSSHPTKVAPMAQGFALEIRNVTAKIVIEDMEFASQPGQTPGDSSIAAFVVNSPNVKLVHAKLTAADAVDGANGTLLGFAYSGGANLVGNDGRPTGGGDQKACSCADGSSSTGGGGGPPEVSGGIGVPSYGNSDQGKGGDTSRDCGAGGTGLSGADAPPTEAADPVTILGQLEEAVGWLPANGKPGSNGKPGQGGGGGAGKRGGGGGGGGCGGCGGRGGAAGSAGGSSVALLALNSPVRLDSCILTTGVAGKGGHGTPGQIGQLGGGGGNGSGTSADKGCAGGSGGKGADGASGGGGAGGVSVAIVYRGSTPQIDGSIVSPGTGGAAGQGGTPGTNDGLSGVLPKQDLLMIS